MPRLPRQKFNPALLAERVDVQMALLRIDKHILASKMDMPIRTLNHKLANGYWTYAELTELFSITKMPSEYILMIFGR